MSYLVSPREYRPKANVTMVQNGTRVSAYNPKTFVFVREKSVGDPTVDEITTVNIPAWVSHELQVFKKHGKVEKRSVYVLQFVCNFLTCILSHGSNPIFMSEFFILPCDLLLCFPPVSTLHDQAVMNKVKDSFWRSSMASIWMNSIGSGLFTTRTVQELLWGYKDPLLARLAPTNPEVEETFGLMYKACNNSTSHEN